MSALKPASNSARSCSIRKLHVNEQAALIGLSFRPLSEAEGKEPAFWWHNSKFCSARFEMRARNAKLPFELIDGTASNSWNSAKECVAALRVPKGRNRLARHGAKRNGGVADQRKTSPVGTPAFFRRL